MVRMVHSGVLVAGCAVCGTVPPCPGTAADETSAASCEMSPIHAIDLYSSRTQRILRRSRLHCYQDRLVRHICLNRREVLEVYARREAKTWPRPPPSQPSLCQALACREPMVLLLYPCKCPRQHTSCGPQTTALDIVQSIKAVPWTA